MGPSENSRLAVTVPIEVAPPGKLFLFSLLVVSVLIGAYGLRAIGADTGAFGVLGKIWE